MKKRHKWMLFGGIGVAVAGVSLFLGFGLPREAPSHWDLKNAEYVQANETALPGQIVFLGDSLTEGYVLDQYLESDLALYNRGIGGDVTTGVLMRLDSNVLAISPSVIVLLIGINDLHSGVPVETILANLETILERIQTALPACEVYLQSYYPTNDTSLSFLPPYWDEIDAMNVAARALADDFGYSFLDVHDALTDGDELNRDYSMDGLHLNETGYEIISAILAGQVPEIDVKE